VFGGGDVDVVVKTIDEAPHAEELSEGSVGVDAKGFGGIPFAERWRSHMKMHLS
jgi:hypothetical protein